MCPLLVAELLSILWPFLPAEPILTCTPAHQAASLPHASAHRQSALSAAFPGTEAMSLGEGVHHGVGHSERTRGIWGGVWDSFHACHKIFSRVAEGLSLLVAFCSSSGSQGAPGGLRHLGTCRFRYLPPSYPCLASCRRCAAAMGISRDANWSR